MLDVVQEAYEEVSGDTSWRAKQTIRINGCPSTMTSGGQDSMHTSPPFSAALLCAEYEDGAGRDCSALTSGMDF
jgi:hypothetical protein